MAEINAPNTNAKGNPNGVTSASSPPTMSVAMSTPGTASSRMLDRLRRSSVKLMMKSRLEDQRRHQQRQDQIRR